MMNTVQPETSTQSDTGAPTIGETVLAAIATRHSISPKQVGAPGPERGAVLAIIAAAAAPPDHGRLHPWRFINFPAATRPALADVFEAALLERLPDATADARTRAREKAARAPVLLGLVMRLSTGENMPHRDDQVASCGAALQNVLLAAHAMGYGARALSGKAVRTQAFRRALGLADSEEFLCFIPIGTPLRAPRENARPAPETLLSDWAG